MKKTLVSALTTALVVGAASTTFAASNPFSDVPQGHWAYDAINQLVDDNVIDGYGDGTFRGDRTITRYEAAKMVAKAMAKNPTGNDAAVVDKLRAEFADELNNLGVRVSDLERNADKVKWNGVAEYTATSNHAKVYGVKNKTNNSNLLFRLEPKAEVNDHWHVNARLDANTQLHTDRGNNGNVELKRVWAQGDYDKFSVKLGKFASINDDSIADTPFSGAEVSFGNVVKAQVGAGRLSDGRFNADPANYQYIGLEASNEKLYGGLAWQHLNSNAIKTIAGYKNHGQSDEANILFAKAGYNFDKNVGVKGWYSNNHDADRYEQAASLEVDYKGAEKENQGTWGAWLAYRHLGGNAMIHSTYDAIDANYKGWEIGGNYTAFKNVVATLRYGDEKGIFNKNFKAQNFFGRVEFFF